jgi:hypothetical protein
VGHHRRQSEVVDVPASVDVPGARYSAELLRLLQRAAESVLLLRPGSLVSDTIYDQVVPQVFTDSAMPVNCKIAAGTAFLEIRRSDAKGLQLTRLAEHQMQAMVTGGMGGWRWTDANAPTVACSGTGCSRR